MVILLDVYTVVAVVRYTCKVSVSVVVLLIFITGSADNTRVLL